MIVTVLSYLRSRDHTGLKNTCKYVLVPLLQLSFFPLLSFPSSSFSFKWKCGVFVQLVLLLMAPPVSLSSELPGCPSMGGSEASEAALEASGPTKPRPQLERADTESLLTGRGWCPFAGECFASRWFCSFLFGFAFQLHCELPKHAFP